MAPTDIIERLGDLARFYLNEKPHKPLSQSECEELASELSKAAAEIQRLRAALAAEREECAKVAEALDAYRSYIDSSDEEVADSGLSRADLLAKARAIDPYDGETPVADVIRARGS